MFLIPVYAKLWITRAPFEKQNLLAEITSLAIWEILFDNISFSM